MFSETTLDFKTPLNLDIKQKSFQPEVLKMVIHSFNKCLINAYYYARYCEGNIELKEI